MSTPSPKGNIKNLTGELPQWPTDYAALQAETPLSNSIIGYKLDTSSMAKIVSSGSGPKPLRIWSIAGTSAT